ncbi:hypothetical protein Mgra_00004516 [Meloidogyne graminicola]|uniref:Cytoplasmic tRNA 2-thiolation protein 2 n=1 Tax=Meloidogyne graminicola TaxID=189291 RepID=A0A8S9ZR39_9BILA|nr:hypothetical protein Mgra_00004516 [Meloidogyne graminicola]
MNSENSSIYFIPCVKCTEGDGSFFRLENTKLAGYCVNCFPKVIQHKFSSSLGKNRVFKTIDQRNALLVFTTKNLLESLQLLKLTFKAISGPDDHRVLRLDAKVLVLFDEVMNTFELKKQFNQLKTFLTKQEFYSKWNWRFAHLASIFNKFENFSKEFKNEDYVDGEENTEKLFNLISKCQSSSVRLELIRLIRTKLLAKYAAYFGFPSVLLSDNADQLATETINSLCFGRGSSIFDISSVIDDRVSVNSLPFANHSIQFIRPLRDISYKELDSLNRIEKNFERIEENGIEKIINGEIKEENSVQNLSKDFIESLRDNGFPATISTILSVSSKIESERNGQICFLCFCRFERKKNINNDLILLKLCEPCLSIIEDIENEGIILLKEIIKI